MNTGEVKKMTEMASPIMLTPGMQARIDESHDEKTLFELLKTNISEKLENIKQYYEKTSILRSDDYFVTYHALMDMRSYIISNINEEQLVSLNEPLRRHDVIFGDIDNNHDQMFLSTLRLYYFGQYKHEQLLMIMNKRYQDASNSLFSILTTFYNSN